MTMFQYYDDDGSFIIESGSDGVPLPVFKVSGSTVYISGSLLPADSGTDNPYTELGSMEKPWKELYVESGSINFIDPKVAVNNNNRRVKFSRKDVEDLKSGRPLHPQGHLSASGDFHAHGRSELRGNVTISGETNISGDTTITGYTDIRGTFKVGGENVSDLKPSLDYARELRGAANPAVTATEFAKLDGLTASTAELNIMDGVTATTSELNIMDGVTATTAELNKMDGVTATTAELNIMDGVTATTAELNKMDGVTSTTAELNILDGVTSTAAELNIMDGVTATTAELNKMDGVTATTAELNYTDGVTSNIQTQLNGKYTVGATVPSDLIPDRDARSALGAANRRWTELYVQTSVTDGYQVSKGVHILGGQGAVTVSQIPTNGVLDARAANVFYMGVDGTINGITGSRITGQVVTIISPSGRRNDFVHQALNVNVHATEKFVFLANRNFSLRGPQAARFIYDGTLRVWYRLF